MTQAPETASGKVAKLNRVERNAWTKRKILDAATKIVGKYGYSEASVARITEEAGVAQGTFYNHFVINLPVDAGFIAGSTWDAYGGLREAPGA
jgi:Bacterial regulatory proteins, tetR family